MNQIIKLGVGIVLAGLLTACGPDGDSGGEEKGILSKGGECVDIGHSASKKGVFTKRSVVIPGAPESFIESKILEYNAKEFKGWTRIYNNQNIEATTITKGKHYQKNNYLHLTESNMTMTYANVDATATIFSTYDPYGIRGPYEKVCKGQTWVDAFTAKIISYPKGEKSNQQFTDIHGIEDINVEKTVVAGDFDTYILTHYADKDKKIIMSRVWIDMKDGFSVYSESYDNGQVKSISELIEFDQ